MNQAELQLLTKERILDVKALLRGKRWAFAYYVSGYAVECALKSCVLARMVDTGWIFEDKARFEACRTHDFEKLIDLAGLENELDVARKFSLASGGVFATNWQTVKTWKPEVRYNQKTESEAKVIFDAITAKNTGVLAWIEKFW